MKRNTIGVLFYSTPHRGSSLAKYSNQAKYMLYPSVEVKELNEGLVKPVLVATSNSMKVQSNLS